TSSPFFSSPHGGGRGGEAGLRSAYRRTMLVILRQCYEELPYSWGGAALSSSQGSLPSSMEEMVDISGTVASGVCSRDEGKPVKQKQRRWWLPSHLHRSSFSGKVGEYVGNEDAEDCGGGKYACPNWGVWPISSLEDWGPQLAYAVADRAFAAGLAQG
ncbi:unnamed protein product, partial [Choristocarpus tenellus]